MNQSKYKLIRDKFFSPQEAQKLLESVRKAQAVIEFEKSNGERRAIEAFVCYSDSRHQWILNQSLELVDAPEFRTVPLSRVMSITIDGKKIEPKRKKVICG